MIRKLLAVVGAALLLLGTGVQGAAASTPPNRVHFRTPEGAMRYLARAYNRHDTAALRHVTNAMAREELAAMRDFAVNLTLDHCAGEPTGMYSCDFSHDYPSRGGVSVTHGGFAHMRVAPADRPGFYAKGDVGCG